MPRFLADENCDDPMLHELARLGHDIVTVAMAGLRGSPDANVLQQAASDDRIVLTFDRWDFERLHRNNPNHAGIVSCTDDDPLTLARRIHDAVTAVGDMSGQHVRVNKP